MEFKYYTTILSILIVASSLMSLVYPMATVSSQHPGTSHRPADTPGTKLEYAQHPADFLKSKGYDIRKNTNANVVPNQNVYHSNNNNGAKPSSSFDGALPYGRYVSRGNNANTRTQTGDDQPSVALYNKFKTQPTNYGNTLSSHSNVYHGTRYNNPSKIQENHVVQPYRNQLLTPTGSKTTTYYPKSSNLQGQLDFDLFNNQNFGQSSPYLQQNPFVRHSLNGPLPPTRQLPYDTLTNSNAQIGNNYNDYGRNYDYNGNNRPVLSQGFSIPTTYQGQQHTRTNVMPKEAFSSVTDPSMDKRITIGSYVPSNNFVNPSNFLIPTEDKYNMINRIFGGFQMSSQHQKKPKRNQHDALSSPSSSSSSSSSHLANKPQSTTVAHNNGRDYTNGQKYTANGYLSERETPIHDYNNIPQMDYNKYQNVGPSKQQDVVASSKVQNRGPYTSQTKTMTRPGYGKVFQDAGRFSQTPLQSTLNTDQSKSTVFGVRDDRPTLLFSDFTYDNPLSLNQFRSKNLLGDEDFGKTEYDNNRITPDTVFNDNNRVNDYRGREFFAPKSNSHVSGSVSGDNGYKQVGGTTLTTGKSFDKSYGSGSGYDKTFDDNAKSTTGHSVGNYDSPRNEYSQSDGYSNAGAYSDNDGFSKSYGYSDGGGDSDFKATDDKKHHGFQESYENRDDNSDKDSYNDVDGYSNAYYDGKNHDVSDGYTNNVKYNTKDQDSNLEHYDADSDDGYRQGVAKVASALTSGTPTLQPYRGLVKSVTDDLPSQANYKPFDVNGPAMS